MTQQSGHTFREFFLANKTNHETYLKLLPPIIATLFPVLCLLSFADKAINIDDPLFIWTARHILQSPWDFYGFIVNWYGFTENMSIINQNPPGVAYYLALFGYWLGGDEIAFHIAMLLPAAGLGLGTWLLARHFCHQPLLATLISLTTPVFMVSATSLMADLLMSTFYVWAVTAWVYGLKKQRSGLLALAALCILAAALTKYFALSLLPLLVVYTWFAIHRIKPLFFLLIPLAGVAAYELLSYQLYGQALLSYAGSYASARSGFGMEQLAGRIPAGLLFLGGGYLSVLMLAPFSYLISKWQYFVFGSGVVMLGIVLLPVIYPVFGWLTPVGVIIQMVVFGLAGLYLLALCIREGKTPKDADSLLLVLWLLGVFCFAVLFNWTVSARVLLPAVPVVGILVVRHLQVPEKRSAIILLPALLVGMVVAQADYALAQTTRSAVQDMIHAYRDHPQRVWFNGSWGFRYYMQENKQSALDLLTSHLRPGDIIITPVNNTNNTLPVQVKWHVIDVRRYPVRAWAAVMDSSAGAGFYSHRWGMMPFILGLSTEEIYLVSEVENDVDFSLFEHVRHY